MARRTTKESSPPPTAQSYEHREAKTPLRPDVGTCRRRRRWSALSPHAPSGQVDVGTLPGISGGP